MTKESYNKGKRKVCEINVGENDYDYNDEIWKPCHLTDLYEVSDIGRVRRSETKTVRKNAINPHGYQYLTFPIGGKSYTCLVGRLVLHAFVGQPLDGEVAHHIDGNSDNDILENLKWASIGEAGTTRCFPSTLMSRSVIAESLGGDEVHLFISPLEASFFIGCTRGSIYDAIRFDRKFHGYTFDYDASDEPTCRKKKVAGWESYMISEDGRIKGQQGGWKMGTKHGVQSQSSTNVYRRSELTKWIGDKKVRKKKYIHTLVSEAFLGECPDGYQVNHIDGDTSHNDVSNLQYVNKSENNKRAYKNGRKPPNEKAVVLIKPDGTFSRFKSSSEGARETGCSIASVSKSISEKRKNGCGEYWAHDKPVVRYMENEDSTKRFESLSVASRETGENILHILMNCRDEDEPSWTYES